MLSHIFKASIVVIFGTTLSVITQAPPPAQMQEGQGASKEEAARRFKVSAEHGDPIAMYQFAKLGQSEEVRLEWLKRSAAKDYGPAMLELSIKINPRRLDKNLTPAEKSQKRKEYQYATAQAYKALVVWAGKGDAESMYRIGTASGVFAKEGISTEHECLPWIRKAVELGHDEAPIELALKLIRIGDTSEKTEGFGWLKRSTEIGFRRYQAAAELTRYYTYGFPEIELKRNPKEPWKWARKGAELQGIPVGDFLAENGLEDPDKVKPGVILFQ
ncbi:MAG: sel1 repeat family protein [Acidobacteria bacterium]|nr:sel1 repeat family protein [Acidobacteriota bacterium]